MATTSFWEHPIDRLEEALSIRKQIATLQDKLGSLFGGDAPASTGGSRKGGRRRMSPAARSRIAAAQRARWAKQKGTTATGSGSALSAGRAKRRGKRTMSPEARERIAAAQRARWAKVKGKAGSTGAVQKSPSKGRGGKRKISPEARAKMAEAARRRWAKVKRGG